MATLREIKNRIQAVSNTQKITKTMEMISAAKAKKATDKVHAAQPYAHKIKELMDTLSSLNIDAYHPLLRKPDEVKTVALLVITANRGLCGGYNNNVIRLAIQKINEYEKQGKKVQVHLVGKKAISVFKYRKREFAEGYTDVSDNPSLEETARFSNQFMESFERGEIDAVEIVYTKYLSASRQAADVMPVLPLTLSPSESEKKAGGNTAALFEPNAEQILTSLLPRAIRVACFQAFLDSVAGEHIARRIAMKNATDSAQDMIKDMTRHYNRARQAKITQEISEIVAGADAIS